uniref:Uncharacterized protein n=1 Tax=Rhizophora mucronata TaxID=61149 RepID=A0A2P2PVS0_RHIMU
MMKMKIYRFQNPKLLKIKPSVINENVIGCCEWLTIVTDGVCVFGRMLVSGNSTLGELKL